MNHFAPDRLLHSDATASLRWTFTRMICLLWIVRYLVSPFERFAIFPREARRSVGLLAALPDSLLDVLLTGPVLFGSRMVLLAVLIGCLWRSLFPVLGLVAAVLITCQQSYVRGFITSYAGHESLACLFCLYALVLFAWADRPGEKKGEPADHAAPLVTCAFLITLTYALVGWARWYIGGFAIFLDHDIYEFAMINAYRYSPIDLHLHRWLHESPWLIRLLSLGFFVTTLVEMVAPLALVSRRFRRVFIVTSVGFHIGAFLLMKILFWQNLVLLLFFVDVRDWYPLREEPRTPHAKTPPHVHTAA